MKLQEIRWNWNSSANNQELQEELEKALTDNWDEILENSYKHVRIQRVMNAITDIVYNRRLVQSDETNQKHHCKSEEICKYFESNCGGYQPVISRNHKLTPPGNE